MSLMNIKTKEQSGFTIVELLIVVVVIAILAAITLVSFNNITNRANDSSAKEAAANVQKKIELYNAEETTYPTTAAQLTAANKSYSVPSGLILASATAVDKDNGKSSVEVFTCNTNKGNKIGYWEYNKTGGAGKTYIDIGDVGTSTGATLTGCTRI